MNGFRKRRLGWTAAAVVLMLLANGVVAVLHLGKQAGTRYRWVCPTCGAELTYATGSFGSARLTPGRSVPEGDCPWELVSPQPPSAFLPWNWLARLLASPAPDPAEVHRKAQRPWRE